MKNTPEVRIQFSHLLYQTVSKRLAEFHKRDIASIEDCEKWTIAYQKEWVKHEKLLLGAMQEILHLKFYKQILDVYTAPFIIPMSSPTILHFRNEPDEFVDVLTHELLHVLLTDNNLVSTPGKDDSPNLIKEWERLFGDEHDLKTLVHIPVHAVHKKIYLDNWHDESRLARDMAATVKYNAIPYINAWKYVDEIGHEKIIEQLVDSYEILGKDRGTK